MKNLQVSWLLILAYTFNLVCANVYYPATKHNNEWWSNAILYQIYPRSFKDSNGDGIGDLKGIMQKLDHFVDLGIEAIWIGPIFKSPQNDMGYDIEDYSMIDPLFGTLEDFDELISEMNKRDLKFITDFVPNHSSYKCAWFQKSIKQDPTYDKFYIWRNAKNQEEISKNSSIVPIAPNNWISVFGYPAWTWNKERKQFYLHQFSPKQPDYNLRNPEVHQAFFKIFKFWMDRKVVGFRFDATKHLYEDDLFRDEPYEDGKNGSILYGDLEHIYTCDLPENIEIVKEWRQFLENYNKQNKMKYSPLLLTESYSSYEILKDYYGNSTNPGSHVPFNYVLMTIDKNDIVQSIDNNIKIWLDIKPKNMVPNWMIENHDNSRIATSKSREMVPLLTVLKLFLPGLDISYYGTEIGMEDSFVRHDQRQDPNNAGVNDTDKTRDPERCPMQWDDSINAGFTDAKKPWLPINPNYYKINVEAQKKIPNSNYNIFKKMSFLRKTDTLKYGDLQTYNVSKSIYILKRSLSDHDTYIAVMNFGSETEEVVLANDIDNLSGKLYVYLRSENSLYNEGNIIFTNYPDKPLLLRPQSVVLLTTKVMTSNESSNSSISSTLTGSNLLYVFFTLLIAKYCQ